MKKNLKITCPICSKQNTWEVGNRYKPFCSYRCKLIDLGEWASDVRKIPGNPIAVDLGIAIHNDYDALILND